MKVYVPPIKSQGIKTKLVPWIKCLVSDDFQGLWIEPFMGTGVVGFNITPKYALMCDTNPHLVNFYNAILEGSITSTIVREYLEEEGGRLLENGESQYYKVRERFNENHNPLDFLFLNRAGFNGMIRFNSCGKFNIPFCRKPHRFAKAYITKIVNQVKNITIILKEKQFIFKCQSFEETISAGGKDDIIYCDPPYIGRHVDYYNGWGEELELGLYESLAKSESKFILSTWHHNDYRDNEYLKTLWQKYNIITREHFYHVGGKEKNRNPIVEALVTNFIPSINDHN
ncbi:MAG: Dam family site-specific DNA-(adenine-N6)-methyltransferase [Candidatus Hatepunaea meridiana]|nr:Dam family site-specific DNA-(adenine-N6)-methyltransferase [Candidatus Hatepunaea meridiana]